MKGSVSEESASTDRFVVFHLNNERYALPLEHVERIVLAVEVTPLPGAPGVIAGAIRVEGSVIPLFDLRRRFSLPPREIGLGDHFLIARSGERTVALVIDEPEGVVAKETSTVIRPEDVAPGLDAFEGVIQLEDGLALIQDLEKFLSPDEEQFVEAALSSSE